MNTVGWPSTRVTVRSSATVPFGVSPSGSLNSAWALFCSTLPAWLPSTLLATSCTRMTKVLLPVSLSAAALETLKVQRTSPPSSPRVPPSAVKVPTVMVPAKSPVSAPLPAVVVISR
ncbi:hypothetical protein D3C78_914960 [compost metagenome]